MKISILKVFLFILGAIGLLMALVVFIETYEPCISEQDLDFLANQKKPLTYSTVAKHLGETEIGPGFYAYRIPEGKKTAEFWISPPPAPSQRRVSSLPIEIAVVVVRSGDAKPTIIWPEELKGKDFDEVIGSIWPQTP